MKNINKQISSLIGEGHTKTALEVLFNYMETVQHHRLNDVILIKGNFEDNNRLLDSGLISTEDWATKRTQVNQAILNITEIKQTITVKKYTSKKNPNNGINNFAGTYMSYRLSPNNKEFFGTPLKIYEDGSVEFKRIGPQYEDYLFKGEAHKFNLYLSINISQKYHIEKKIGYPDFAQYIYYAGNFEKPNGLSHLFGISNFVSMNGKIRACEEILTPLPEYTNIDLIDIKFLRCGINDPIHNLKHREILDFLLKANSMIIHKAPNDPLI